MRLGGGKGRTRENLKVMKKKAMRRRLVLIGSEGTIAKEKGERQEEEVGEDSREAMCKTY